MNFNQLILNIILYSKDVFFVVLTPWGFVLNDSNDLWIKCSFLKKSLKSSEFHCRNTGSFCFPRPFS